MFGVALNIKKEHFIAVLKSPKSVIIGALSQFLLLPAVTFLLILVLQPSAGVAMGMILVAACPGGNISNFISSISKGNIALSVTMTAISTSLAVFATPLNFAFWTSLYLSDSNTPVPIEIDFIEMFQSVFILLGVPLLAGMWIAEKFPLITKKIMKPFRIISLLIFASFVVIAFKANVDVFIKYFHYIVVIVLLHNGLALLTGYYSAKLFRLSSQDVRTIAIETGIQNSGLGLVLIFTYFHGLGGMAIIAAWWGIWHIISGLGIAWFWSRKSKNLK
mgnify:CR=1 FL=1